MSWLLGGRLQYVMIASFALVTILAGGLNTLVTSRVINNYLVNAQNDRMARDMDLANGYYQQKLGDILTISQSVALDAQPVARIPAVFKDGGQAAQTVMAALSQMITAPLLDGTRMILVLDTQGEILTGRVLTKDGQAAVPYAAGNWSQLPIVAAAIADGQPRSGTEVIAANYLTQVGLDRQVLIAIRETPKTAPKPYDPREGTAGLALAGIYPLLDENGGLIGEVMTAYLFNNDFSMVDYAKSVARIETMTVFLGDLRVSTDVLDQANNRAVGTRVSQDVYQKVIVEGQEYIGRSFAVKDWYIGRYEPLRDVQGAIIGMLYVGVRESIFDNLVVAFNTQTALIGLLCILIAGTSALFIARRITRPFYHRRTMPALVDFEF